MKIIALIAAGLMAAASAAPAAAAPVSPAAPQMQERHSTRVVHRTVTHTNGYRNHRTRRVCTNKYRNHRRIRTCRTVRY